MFLFDLADANWSRDQFLGMNLCPVWESHSPNTHCLQFCWAPNSLYKYMLHDSGNSMAQIYCPAVELLPGQTI